MQPDYQQALIDHLMMERRIPVWKARQKRRLLNYKRKAVSLVLTNKLTLLVGLCWLIYAIAQPWIVQAAVESALSRVLAAQQSEKISTPTPTAQAPPESIQHGYQAVIEQEPEVQLRLSYEMTLPAAQAVSESIPNFEGTEMSKSFVSNFLLCQPDHSGILAPAIVISQRADQEGGTQRFVGAAVVDGRLKSANIVAATGHDILFSALSHVEACRVEGKNIMIEGDFSGEITIKEGGVLEIGDSAKVIGVVHTAGAVVIHAGADTADLKVIKTASKAAPVRLEPVPTPQPQAAAVEPNTTVVQPGPWVNAGVNPYPVAALG